jgi:hypothetical protein
MYQNCSDKEFLQLIFDSEGRLGMDYVEEAKTRQPVVVPFLCDVLTKEGNYRFGGKRFWGVIHAVHILGILRDSGAFEAFTSANKLSHKHGIDWIWDALPECYFRLGKGVIPRLMDCVEELKSYDYDLTSEEILGLWNFWDGYHDERQRIESFMLNVIKAPDTHPVTRVSLIADFAQLGRRDLKPLFESFCDRGDKDLDILVREDLDYFFDSVHCPPTSHYDLESFYCAEEIEAWQECPKEESDPEQETLETFILGNLGQIQKNDPCPCGSDKKFKDCHLQWAQQGHTGTGKRKLLN